MYVYIWTGRNFIINMASSHIHVKQSNNHSIQPQANAVSCMKWNLIWIDWSVPAGVARLSSPPVVLVMYPVIECNPVKVYIALAQLDAARLLFAVSHKALNWWISAGYGQDIDRKIS